MYNEKTKLKFISEFSTSVSRRCVAELLFEATEPYEKRWGADICTRDKEEVQQVVDDVVGARAMSQKTRLSILRSYARWCIENNVDGAQDGILQINTVGVEKLKRQTVANPQHLQRYLDRICDDETAKTVSCTYRCFYWLAYSGVLNEKDALDIITSDVDFEDMMIRHGGQEYPIYREAITSFKMCVNLTTFVYKHPNYTGCKEVLRIRGDGNLLLRGFNETVSLYSMRVQMSRRASEHKTKNTTCVDNGILGLKLSYYRVWLSGLFYRMYEAERAGMPVDFTAVAEQFMESKTYKLDSGRNTLAAKRKALARSYLIDYNNWKEAYSI